MCVDVLAFAACATQQPLQRNFFKGLCLPSASKLLELPRIVFELHEFSLIYTKACCTEAV